MQVIAGEFKGRALKSNKQQIRPTSSRVREAVFSILGPLSEHCHFLDLCCGTGAMAIEAVSRGAVNVTGVDRSIRTVSENCRSLGVSDRITLLRMDAKRALSFFHQRECQFDIIYCDPPYAYPSKIDLLSMIDRFDILKNDGVLLFETDKKDDLPTHTGALKSVKQYQYGQTLITRYQKNE